jgi:hypothetical protein
MPNSLKFDCRLYDRPTPLAVRPLHANTASATTVLNWLERYDSALPRFKNILENGAISLFDKEIQAITPLLEEGEKLSKATGCYSPTVALINKQLNPALNQLKHLIDIANAQTASFPKEAKADKKLVEKWMKLGLDPWIPNYHADCARFLMESGLLFTIIGYSETHSDKSVHGIKLDTDGHPLIKFNGKFTRWEEIARQVEYDPKSGFIKTQGTSEEWNYFHEKGLVPVSRFDYKEVFPIYELSQDEYERVLTHSQKFYETNPEMDVGTPKDCAVQFFTSYRRNGITGCTIPESFLTENFRKVVPLHVGIRLITEDRKVYSFGIQIPLPEQDFINADLLNRYLATVIAKVSMIDYEEFRLHEGRTTTSVPLTKERSQKIIDRLNALNSQQIRLQFAQQNCAILMEEVLGIAGYSVDIRSNLLTFVMDMFPSLNQIPLIGGLISKIKTCASFLWSHTPYFITEPLKWTYSVLTWIPTKIALTILNLFTIKLGASTFSTPLPQGVEEEALSNTYRFKNFSAPIRSWKDIFKDTTSSVFHSKYFLDWQNKQKSTFVAPKSHLPKMAIVHAL